jgi:Arc/MetJ-type ribon-helix-helix transcriptional regulator
MKVSVSLPAEDVAFLDEYVQSQGIESRSAAVHKAVKLLRTSELADAYEDAFRSWADEDDSAVWEAVTGDGLGT